MDSSFKVKQWLLNSFIGTGLRAVGMVAFNPSRDWQTGGSEF